MTIKVKNFYVPKVDSLRVRIPMRDVEILNPMLFEKVITISESSGQIYKEDNGIPFKQIKDGITHNIWVKKIKPIGKEYVITYVMFLINSKHLKERYFEGIHSGSIDKILEEINSLKIIKIGKEQLLKAEILDVDFCIDFPATQEEFKESVVNRYSKLAKVGTRDTKKVFGSMVNVGIEFNERERSFPSKPHTKFYHKSTELLNSSNLFAERYLKDYDFTDIGRFEFNMKNRKYFRCFGIDRIKDLKGLLRFSTSHKLFKDVYNNWFEKREIVPKSNYDFKDLMILSLWKMLSINEIELANNWAIGQASNRNQQSKIRRYYHNNMNGTKKQFHEANRIELSKQLDEFFGVDPTSGKRTYDVRSSVIAPSTKINNSKP
jgi:hypothetical protein